MKIVIDANVLFAALIKEGPTRALILKSDLILIAPSYIIVETEKYKKEIQNKAKISSSEVEDLLSSCLSQITLIDDSELIPFLRAAETLTNDDNDLLYLACALKVNADIWTNDKVFQNQTRVKIWTTIQLIEKVYSKT